MKTNKKKINIKKKIIINNKNCEDSQDESDSSKEEEDDKKKDLYSILGVSKTASNSEIKKAYIQLVLKYHPDKNKKANAKDKFIEINEAYKILSNFEARRIYDETGEYEQDEEFLFRSQTINDFRKRITIEDIERYEKEYRGSKEEEEDLIIYYNEHNGDLRHLLFEIPYSTSKDLERYLNIYEKLFKMKKLIKNSKYEETKNKIKLMKRNKEEKEAKELLDKLTKQIKERRKKRTFDDYLSDLAKNNNGNNNFEIDHKTFEMEFGKVFKDLKKKKKKNSNKIKK